MDIRFGQFADAQHESPASVAALDWPGLLARLAAAHAIRRVLAAQSSHRGTGSGSFAPAVAANLASPNPSDGYSFGGVNQNVKVDGKLPGAISANGKDEDPSAVRGLL